MYSSCNITKESNLLLWLKFYIHVARFCHVGTHKLTARRGEGNEREEKGRESATALKSGKVEKGKKRGEKKKKTCNVAVAHTTTGERCKPAAYPYARVASSWERGGGRPRTKNRSDSNITASTVHLRRQCENEQPYVYVTQLKRRLAATRSCSCARWMQL